MEAADNKDTNMYDNTNNNNNKRPRPDSMSISSNSHFNVDNTQSLQSWIHTQAISTLLRNSTNKFKSLYANKSKAQAAFDKLKQYEASNSIPHSLKVFNKLQLPAGLSDIEKKASELKVQYENEQFALLLSARAADLAKHTNLLDNFFIDQQNTITQIVNKEHELLVSLHLENHISADEYTVFFMDTLKNNVKNIISSLSIKQYYSQQKKDKNKVNKIVEQESKLLEKPEETIKQLIQREVKKQVNNIASKTKPKNTQESTPKHKGKPQNKNKGKKTSNKPNKPSSNKSNRSSSNKSDRSSSSNKSNRSNSNKSDSSRHGSNKPKHNKKPSRSDSKNWRSTREEKGPDQGKKSQPKRRPSIGFHKKPQHF